MSILIMIDLDKTLVDEGYQIRPNYEVLLKQKFSVMQNEDFVFCLNSDTPLSSLEIWSNRLGITGPIIAEKGVVAASPGESIAYLIPNHKLFIELRRCFVNILVKYLPKISLIIGDATEFLRQSKVLRSETILPGISGNIAIVNGLRQSSFSFYAKHSLSDYSLTDSPEFMDILVADMRRIINEVGLKDTVDEDINRDYGICIVHSLLAHKKLGVSYVLKQGGFSHVYMIGDSLSDYISHPAVIQCAVGNSSDEYKKRCQIVATKGYSAGVIEILERIRL